MVGALVNVLVLEGEGGMVGWGGVGFLLPLFSRPVKGGVGRRLLLLRSLTKGGMCRLLLLLPGHGPGPGPGPGDGNPG